jgi:hypothetical protein
MIKIVKGIQNHTKAIAAPVTIEAVGTTPMLLGFDEVACAAASIGAVLASGLVSVTATMLSTYGHRAFRDTAFSGDPGGGKPPALRNHFGAESSSAILSGSRNSRT